jgi:hypothetical protein
MKLGMFAKILHIMMSINLAFIGWGYELGKGSELAFSHWKPTWPLPKCHALPCCHVISAPQHLEIEMKWKSEHAPAAHELPSSNTVGSAGPSLLQHMGSVPARNKVFPTAVKRSNGESEVTERYKEVKYGLSNGAKVSYRADALYGRYFAAKEPYYCCEITK